MRAKLWNRVKSSPLFLLAHMVTWCLLWGEFSPANLVNGLLLGLAISVALPMPKLAAEVRLRPWPFVVLVLAFIRDVLVSSLKVGWLSVRFGHQPRSSVVAVPLAGRSDLFLTLTSDLLTLVPGSLVVETDREGGVLYMHFFDAHTPEQIDRARAEALAQERRVLKAFASTEQLRAIGLRPARATGAEQ